jgi:flagellar motor protein MotB
MPARMRSDNGPPFATKTIGGLSKLSNRRIRLGITPERIEPGTPSRTDARNSYTSGTTDIKPAWKDALAQVVAIRTTIPGRHFQVGRRHGPRSDPDRAFPSNWELWTRDATTNRSTFFVAQGMRSEVLSAAGYGDFDPVASNDTPDGRAKNRRTEITLERNINAIPTTP